MACLALDSLVGRLICRKVCPQARCPDKGKGRVWVWAEEVNRVYRTSSHLPALASTVK